MSDDDMFADSGDDTDDLIAASNAKPIAKPKKRLQKKGSAPKKRKLSKAIPDADKGSDGEPGLFDSDDDEKPAAKKQFKKAKPMSKREKMEALQAKKRQENEASAPSSGGGGRSGSGGGNKDGYDSEDTYNSAEYVRTKEDMDFIDTEGDDADAIHELYAEQNFDDERGEAMEEPKKKKKIKGVGSDRARSEADDLRGIKDDDNPIMQAVNKMKRKKRTAKKYGEVEEIVKPFLARMEEAAEEDEVAIAEKRPAIKKLTMVNEVCQALANREYTRCLLDNNVLGYCKRWIQPLRNGKLGNVTVRQKVIQAIAGMSAITGEDAITSQNLRDSEIGKVVMSLYMHKSETPDMKRQLKKLIEQWSRPIFQKSGNMKDLERAHQERGGGGLSSIARSQQMYERQQEREASAAKANDQDIDSLIKTGARAKQESGINRVRVPFSKGFQYTVRPKAKIAGAVDKRRAPKAAETRGTLNKRILEKGRKVSKNQRSANVSVEGRAAK